MRHRAAIGARRCGIDRVDDLDYLTTDDSLPRAPEGSFDSFIDVFFDIRRGSPLETIALGDEPMLTNGGARWDTTPNPGDVVVTGSVGDPTAKLHTGKTPEQIDFVPGVIGEPHPSGAMHGMVPASLPAPATCCSPGSHSRASHRPGASRRSGSQWLI